METQNKVFELPYGEQIKHYTKVRESVTKKLKLVQKVYGQFQKEGQKSSLLMQEVKEKGFTRMISEYEAHVVHLDKKIAVLNILVQRKRNGRKKSN